MRASRSWLPALVCCAAALTPAAAQDRPLGGGAAFGRLESPDTVEVAAGTPLRSRPDATAAVLLVIAESVELQALERRGDWVRTTYDNRAGWLAPDGEATAAAPPSVALRSGWLERDTSPAEDAARLSGARRLLAPESAREGDLGPWPLYTDVTDEALLAFLARLATGLPTAYAARFGAALGGDGAERPVVLFASEESYRTFVSEFTDLGPVHGGGHADGSMAALFVGESSPAEVAANLVHELTHLLNRGAFVEPPATWLEEGRPTDLGSARLAADGTLEAGTLGGESRVMTQRTSARRTVVNTVQTGGQALWTQLARDWRERRARLYPLSRLLDLTWSDFVAAEARSSNYALSTFFVRYLLDGRDAGRAESFRRFIAAAAGGAPSGALALAQALDTTIEALQRDYERWLTAQILSAR